MHFDLDEPQFPPSVLLDCVPGLGVDSFKQWIQRQTVMLSARATAKRGRTPMYRGTDVIQVAAIYELTRQGMQTGKATLAWQTVIKGRLIGWQTQFALHGPPYGRSVFFWLHPETGELMAQDFSEDPDPEDPGDNPLDHPAAPDVMILFRTDRFILHMIERMQKVLAGKPAVEPKAEPRAPLPFVGWADLDGKLEIDDQDRRVMIGLTHEETIEWLRNSNLDIIARMGGPTLYATDEEKWAADERWIELDDKHHRALMLKMMAKQNQD